VRARAIPHCPPDFVVVEPGQPVLEQLVRQLHVSASCGY
jgi:hypothetical protein